MNNLPKSSLVDKFIPKKAFYERQALSLNIKNEFINNVDKVTWKYKLSQDTIGIPKSSTVEEIQIFEIRLKEKVLPKNVISTITKAIPYKILFIIKHNDDICYAINANKDIYTNWNEEVEFTFTGLNLESIYQNIVKTFIKQENNDNDFDIILQTNKQKEELTKKITLLQNKIKKEKQFNKKVQLNKELRNLKEQLEKI